MRRMKHGSPPSHRSAITIIAAFVLSLLAFGCALLLPALLNTHDTELPPAEADTAIGRERTAVLLFRQTDGALTGAVVLTADTRTMTMQAVGYPPETAVREGMISLDSVYRQEGTAAAGTALSTAAALDCDTALSFSVSGVAAFLVYLQDRLCCTLPEPVGELPAGEAMLTPMQTADLLRYTGWKSGAEGQAQIHADVVAALCNRYLLPSRDFEADFAMLTELCDVRLSISQFEAVRQDLSALAKANTGSICTADIAPAPM